MTGTINKTLILGYLGSDPEIFVTDNGKEVARLSIATNDYDGKQSHTEWHKAVIFAPGLIDKVVKPYLTKGSRVHIEGSNRTGKFTTRDGVERSSTDVIVQELTLLDGKPQKSEK